ncbi:hypothetical protein [Amycolatopsis sp. ATCC 39116]|uniref:hypothetical protein n=1 Tax=Amycolatopsis sp. (strain ATCC 39116 / 75iv2) TaxID=385957 RepID=UPI0002625919|nr:hypothetical protein [Amycolatopsis sp. ATCC 39116]
MDPFSALILAGILSVLVTRTVASAVTDTIAQAKGQTPPSLEKWRQRQKERAARGEAPERETGPWRRRWRNAVEHHNAKAAQKHAARMEFLRDNGPQNVAREKAKLQRRAQRWDKIGATVAGMGNTSWEAAKIWAEGVKERRTEARAWKENEKRTADPVDNQLRYAEYEDSTDGAPSASPGNYDDEGGTANDRAFERSRASGSAGIILAPEGETPQERAARLAAMNPADRARAMDNNELFWAAEQDYDKLSGPERLAIRDQLYQRGYTELAATAGMPEYMHGELAAWAVNARKAGVIRNVDEMDRLLNRPFEDALGLESFNNATVLPFRNRASEPDTDSTTTMPEPHGNGDNTEEDDANADNSTPTDRDNTDSTEGTPTAMTTPTHSGEITDLPSALAYVTATSNYCAQISSTFETTKAQATASVNDLQAQLAALETAQSTLAGQGFDGTVTGPIARIHEHFTTLINNLKQVEALLATTDDALGSATGDLNAAEAVFTSQLGIAEQVQSQSSVADNTGFYANA